MLSPAVMFIEQAIGNLKDIPEFIAKSQAKELNSLGDKRAEKAGASGLTDDFLAGYVLGLQTARVILAGSPLLALAHIKPDDVL